MPNPRTPIREFFERHYKPERTKKSQRLINQLNSKRVKNDQKRTSELYGKLARFHGGLQTPDLLEHQLNQILSNVKFLPSDDVLSIGSGTGLTETFIAKNVLHSGKMTCVDVAHGMSKVASVIKGKENASNMHVITASGTNIPVRAGTQDVVLCIQSNLPDMKSWGKILDESRRVLRPIGRAKLVVTLLPEEKNKGKVISKACEDLEKHDFAIEKLLHYLDIDGPKGKRYYGVIVVARPITIFG